MHEVSIVIVSWNTKDFLLGCLESLRQDTAGLDCETTVVDNASSDGSPQVVREQFPDVRVIEAGENLGFARANNIGITESEARYICVVNSDIVVREGCIRNLTQFMDAHPKVGIAGPRVLNPDGTLQPSCRRLPSLRTSFMRAFALDRAASRGGLLSGSFMNEWGHDAVRKVEALSGCFWVVRREALDEVGLLDESFFMYGEDLDWCKRFGDAGWDVAFCPEAEAVHFGGGSSAKAPIRCFLDLQKANLQYWGKHHGTIKQFLHGLLLLTGHMWRLAAKTLLSLVLASKGERLRGEARRHLAFLRWFFGSRSSDRQGGSTEGSPSPEKAG